MNFRKYFQTIKNKYCSIYLCVISSFKTLKSKNIFKIMMDYIHSQKFVYKFKYEKILLINR